MLQGGAGCLHQPLEMREASGQGWMGRDSSHGHRDSSAMHSSPLSLPGAKFWSGTAPPAPGWGHTTGQMEGLALGNHLWAEAWLHHTHTSAPAEFPKENCPCSRRMAHCPLWLGTNTQSPNNLVLAGASFFLYLIFFVVVVFSLLKTNFRFVSWK